jgi:hypothetical protein
MDDTGKDTVARVLGELLRAPDPVRDIELERALTRLQAARGDTPYLLLHRVLVLETALLQLRQRADSAATLAPPATPAVPTPARSFLRDAAVVTLGVVAGQALWDGLGSGPDSGLGGLGDLLE